MTLGAGTTNLSLVATNAAGGTNMFNFSITVQSTQRPDATSTLSCELSTVTIDLSSAVDSILCMIEPKATGSRSFVLFSSLLLL